MVLFSFFCLVIVLLKVMYMVKSLEKENDFYGDPMLAFYYYPFAENQDHREYTEEELLKPNAVEELFDLSIPIVLVDFKDLMKVCL